MTKTKLFIFALLALTLAGCRKPSTQQEMDAHVARHIKVFNYQGHRYLFYERQLGRGGVGGVVHDPDCPCHEKGEEND